MVSRSQRYVIVYNGEVYNFAELKKELAASGGSFRGGSDTEVILEAIEQWGVLKTVQRCNGMFAFGLWDRQERILTLARDRVGIKPLYYGWSDAGFVFGSELKAIEAVSRGALQIERGAASLLLGFNYIPAPWSIYSGIYKLPPGCVLTLRESDLGTKAGEFSPWPEALSVSSLSVGRLQRFWSPHEVVKAGITRNRGRTEEEALQQLEEALVCSVRKRMISDVPLGAFLSGGIDSSLVVALMQRVSDRPVKTFSIGFNEALYNEAPHALAIAEHLGTDHTELYLSASEAMAVIPDLPQYFDEPFSDASQIPTYLVSHLARQHVTVSLSGDGGDELFCGYTRYFLLERLWRMMRHLPPFSRKPIAQLLRAVPQNLWHMIFCVANPVLPKRFRLHSGATKIHRLAEFLEAAGSGSNSLASFYRCGISHWLHADELVSPQRSLETFFENSLSQVDSLNDHEFMMFSDLQTYLPDDILTKVDRASMAVSLEARVPLLDHNIVELAWSLPQSMRVRQGESKWVLKQILKKEVPSALLDRPKMGFGIPHDDWLRGELREWAEDLLSEESLKKRGFFQVKPVRQAWKQHLDGTRNWQYHIWDVLMLQAWLQSRNASL
jgi:asparagine synthase (glutamine-hydrolysing)